MDLHSEVTVKFINDINGLRIAEENLELFLHYYTQVDRFSHGTDRMYINISRLFNYIVKNDIPPEKYI